MLVGTGGTGDIARRRQVTNLGDGGILNMAMADSQAVEIKCGPWSVVLVNGIPNFTNQ